MIHQINSNRLTLSAIHELVLLDTKIELSQEAIDNIVSCRAYLEDKLKDQKAPIYGINTGFGSLYNVKISDQHLSKLQENLVMSHACGTGDRVPKAIIKLMLFFKIQSLSYGHSGVQLETVERLVDFYNNDILPVIFEQGSLGASGDLAPLAHLALPLLGRGSVYYKGEEVSSDEILAKFNWNPITLKAKEGLALLNGTQFMVAYGVHALLKAYKLSYLADLTASISLEAFDGRIEPFDDLIHLVRPHNGQLKTAKMIRDFVEGSELISQEKKHVQDPYSFRCVPQVHGATKDTLAFIKKTFETEINAVTDNPNIFTKEDKIISGGNFHGQPLALTLDYLAIALSELGNISERRTFQLVSGLRGLPAFLVNNPGLNSGFMIPQYTAASIVSQNKQFSTPASIDSIVSSNGQEDHVSMGANAATKAVKVVDNIERILAIEFFTATQALNFRKPLKSSDFIEAMVSAYRNDVAFVDEDRELHIDIHDTVSFLSNIVVETEELFG